MRQSSLQIWELLLLARNPKIPIQITCAECFTLMEYDADLLAAGVSIDEIRLSIHHPYPYAQGANRNLANGLKNLKARKILNPDHDWV